MQDQISDGNITLYTTNLDKDQFPNTFSNLTVNTLIYIYFWLQLFTWNPSWCLV